MANKMTTKLYSHYRNSSIDALCVSKEWKLSPALFSVLKYIQRHGKKEGNTNHQDMLKAAWYLVYETASMHMPHDIARILSDELTNHLDQACQDYSYPKEIDATQDSSNCQSEIDYQEIAVPG